MTRTTPRLMPRAIPEWAAAGPSHVGPFGVPGTQRCSAAFATAAVS